MRYNKSITATKGTKAVIHTNLYHDWRIIKMSNAKTTKTVKYTDEATATVKAMYAEGASVDSIAQAVGKSVKSVTAKLVREGVYKKVEKASENKSNSTKGQLASTIGAVLGMSKNDAESLSSATKKALETVFAALVNSKPIS